MVLTNIKSLLSGCIIVSCCMLITACATAPIQEMSDARQSLQAAHDAGAKKYASTTLQSAKSALEQAEKKLGDRAFREARMNAITAKVEAMDAQKIALAIADAETAISRAAKNGTLSPEAESLFKQAQQAASEGKKQQAVKLANEAKLKAEQLPGP